jgi:ABC-type transporter Mla subunit MlaD
VVRLPAPADVVGALQAQTEALAQLPVTVLALNRTVRDLVAIVSQARETFDTLNRIANRADGLLDELEEPISDLLPGLRRAAEVLDDPVIGEIPSAVRSVTEDVVPMVKGLREAQERITGIATATERLTGFPGSAFLRGRRPSKPDPDLADAVDPDPDAASPDAAKSDAKSDDAKPDAADSDDALPADEVPDGDDGDDDDDGGSESAEDGKAEKAGEGDR